MADIKRTIEGLEHCLARYDDGLCDDCHYMGEIDRSYMIPMKCREIIMRDALELLKEQQWIPVSKRLPDPNIEVLVSCYETNFRGDREYRTTVAVYIPKFTVRSCEKFDGSCDIESVEEYNEENDEYYVREGWYEESYDGTTFEGKSFILYGKVVAWKQKPQPTKDGEQE